MSAGLKYSGANSAFTNIGTGGNQGDERPAAYLNYILFDKTYKVLDAGWQLAPAATFTKQKISFETKDITEEGYLVAWLSYDDDSNNWVYFDDFKVTHTQTNVIQYNEYYPFGMQTAQSWTRENNTGNPYLYNQGSELNSTTANYEMHFRSYDPALGRMNGVDVMADSYSSITPYQYAVNNPVHYNDPTGAITDDQWWNSPRSMWRDGMSPQQRSEQQLHYAMSPQAMGGFVNGGQMHIRNGSLFNNMSASFGNVANFINAAISSEFGGTWSDGSGYLFSSQEQAFAHGMGYNYRHGSWGNTVFKSAKASLATFKFLNQSTDFVTTLACSNCDEVDVLGLSGTQGELLDVIVASLQSIQSLIVLRRENPKRPPENSSNDSVIISFKLEFLFDILLRQSHHSFNNSIGKSRERGFQKIESSRILKSLSLVFLELFNLANVLQNISSLSECTSMETLIDFSLDRSELFMTITI